MSGLLTLSTILATTWCAASKFEKVTPRAGQVGTAVEVTVTAAGIADDARLVFSAPGLEGKKVGKSTFEVTISKDARLGDCDVRVMDADGLSNPRIFTVTNLPVVVEKEENETPEAAQAITLPCVVEAEFAKAADVDHYTFEGEKGDVILIRGRAETLDSVAQPAIRLIGPDGTERGHYFFGSEAWFPFALPEAGKYIVQATERAFRGSNISWYRLVFHSRPAAVATFPSVVQVGKSDQTVQRIERLSESEWGERTCRLGTATPRLLPGIEPFGRSIRLHLDDGWGEQTIRVTDLPVHLEGDSENDAFAAAQPVHWPVEICGQFETPADQDWYVFEAAKGDKIAIHASGPEMDLDVAIHDESEKRLAAFADSATPKTFPVDHAVSRPDALGIWTAPKDGTYRLVVRDLFGSISHGPDRVYRVSLRRAGSHADVWALEPSETSGWMVPRGGSTVLQVATPRWHGYTGPIQVTAKDAPDGITVIPAWIPNGANTAYLVVSADESIDADVVDLELQATGEGEPKTAAESFSVHVPSLAIVRKGEFARIRQSEGTYIGMGGPAPFRLVVKTSEATLQPGGKLACEIEAVISEEKLEGSIQCEWFGLPKELTGTKSQLSADKASSASEIAASAKASPGKYTAVLKATYQPKKSDKDKKAPPAVTIWSNGLVIEVLPKKKG